MKKKVHPQYYPDAQVTCSCGASFTVGSTKKQIHVEVCSACHPLFTGKMKYVDTLGRVEKFQSKQKAAQAATAKAQKKQKRKKKQERPKSLKEMLKGK